MTKTSAVKDSEANFRSHVSRACARDADNPETVHHPSQGSARETRTTTADANRKDTPCRHVPLCSAPLGRAQRRARTSRTKRSETAHPAASSPCRRFGARRAPSFSSGTHGAFIAQRRACARRRHASITSSRIKVTRRSSGRPQTGRLPARHATAGKLQAAKAASAMRDARRGAGEISIAGPIATAPLPSLTRPRNWGGGVNAIPPDPPMQFRD